METVLHQQSGWTVSNYLVSSAINKQPDESQKETTEKDTHWLVLSH